jgi:ABC-type tungstate transport system substrate-binding protein
MLLGALRSDQDLFSIPARYLPARWEWSNLVEVWSQVPLLAYLRATLVIAGVTTLIVLVVSLPTAWYTARHRFRGRNLFLYLILATQMFAPVALVVGLYREYTLVDTVMANVGLGLRATSSYWAIIMVYSAFNLAFAVWILSGYFRSISREIEEAALIDGLGRLKVLLRVVLPLAKPGVVTVPIFTLRVDPAGEPCGCGGRGCVETVASAAAIARRYAARTGRPVAGAAAVAARVRKGDPDAVAVWEEAVGALAEGLAAAVTLLAPRLVVVGGGLAGAGELLLRPLAELLRLRLSPRSARMPRLVGAALGDQAGCLGAALLARRALHGGAPL